MLSLVQLHLLLVVIYANNLREWCDADIEQTLEVSQSSGRIISTGGQRFLCSDQCFQLYIHFTIVLLTPW